MPAIYPIPDEYYRIQNVEYATFIELSVPNENAEVTMRLQKPFVEKQQVRFVQYLFCGSHRADMLAVGIYTGPLEGHLQDKECCIHLEQH